MTLRVRSPAKCSLEEKGKREEGERHTRKNKFTRVLMTSLDRGGGKSSSMKDLDDNVVMTLTLALISDRASNIGE